MVDDGVVRRARDDLKRRGLILSIFEQ